MDFILEMNNITKQFPGVLALDSVNFKVRRGSVHALVGENGAGKSTLMKVLNGVYHAEHGEIRINGQRVDLKDSNAAQRLGIGLVYQEFNLVDALSAAENIYLNRLFKRKNGTVDWVRTFLETQKLIDDLGFDFSAKSLVGDLRVAQKQLIEIAKVISQRAEIIVMDEPTSALTEYEVQKLYDVVRRLQAQGKTVIYISHKLEEVFELCDTVTILRDGKTILTEQIENLTRDDIVRNMVRRPVEMTYPRVNTTQSEVVLQVDGISRKPIIKDVSFKLHKGEVLGIAGLVGSGRTELAELLFGAMHYDGGVITVKGRKVKILSTKDGKENGIGLLTEDRKGSGLVLQYDLARNITITNLKRICKRGILNKKLEREYSQQYAKALNVKTPSMNQIALNLSGGNQQKVVFAKWLFSDVDIFILDEPTRGIDVGAKYEIYLLINKLTEEGKSVIMISSEMPEVLGMSDRVVVLSEGEKMGELNHDEATPEAVMNMMIRR